MRILQVSTRDRGGGAERVAWDLFDTYRRRGLDVRLAVGYKHGDDPDVVPIPHEQAAGRWPRLWWRAYRALQPYRGRMPGARWACKTAHRLAAPAGWWDTRRGREDFHYPGTWLLPDLPSFPPDVLHGHNLHGYYFDLRALPFLSRRLPVVLTLHDAWLLTGHCAHFLNCDRWAIGCGNCPDLSLYPAVRRDATNFNWRRKADLYRQSRVCLATPCRWLMDQVKRSMLAEAATETRVIPYGIDLSVFQPGCKQEARQAVNLPLDARVVLFVAPRLRENPWKDYRTLRGTARQISASVQSANMLFVALGDGGREEILEGGATIRFVPFVSERRLLAAYYHAADLFAHAARADTFPLVTLEALACGLPVVATKVGGIGEQIKPLDQTANRTDSLGRRYGIDQATGILVSAGDSAGMAQAIAWLLDQPVIREEMGRNAAADARARFDLNRHANDYLCWYREILEKRAAEQTADRISCRPPSPCMGS